MPSVTQDDCDRVAYLVSARCEECESPWLATPAAMQRWPRCPFCSSPLVATRRVSTWIGEIAVQPWSPA